MLKYNQQLIQAILWDSPPIAKIVNVKVIRMHRANPIFSVRHVRCRFNRLSSV